MSTLNLKAYIEQKNAYARIFKSKVINVNNLTNEDAQEIFQKLSSDLSPENLSCDGELPRAQVNARFKFYSKAKQELEALGFVCEDQYAF